MSNLQASTSLSNPALPVARSRLFDEVVTLLGALLQPGPLVREVETMGKQLAQARRLETSDPARAAQLRRQAARACA